MLFFKLRDYLLFKIFCNRLIVVGDLNLLNMSLYNLCIFVDKNDIFDKNEIIL